VFVFEANLLCGAYFQLSVWWLSIYSPQRSSRFNCWSLCMPSEVCCDVGVEPALQPLDCEPLHFATANSAHLDDVARDFWGAYVF